MIDEETTDMQDATTTEMVESLSADEKERAARTSYRYFVASDCQSGDQPPNEQIRLRFAKRMARRHLEAEKGNSALALRKMRDTLHYREEMRVDVIRRCFYHVPEKRDDGHASGGAEDGDGALADPHSPYRERLGNELTEGNIFVRGRGRAGHPLLCVLTHKYASGFSQDWYMKYNIYTLERALAVAERESDGRLEKVIAAFDFGQYTNRFRPPLGLSKDLLFCLRDHYPERIECIILVDTPVVFRAFWKLLRPFIDPNTKGKIRFVTGDDEKTAVVGDLVDPSCAMPFMIPGGKLESELDMERYLYGTPFDRTVEENLRGC